MERILVTGGDGMLGEAIKKVFNKDEVCLTDKEELDVRIPLKEIYPKPDCIIHLAAETDLEYCETYPRHAFYTNTIGTFNMVELARKLDIPIIYMSTAGVFGHTSKEYFDENSIPDPINTYGRSKYYGELAVRSYPNHYIFRISWAFGGGSRDRKFVMKICKQISLGKKEIQAIDDKCGSPSYTRDVAKVIYDFISEKTGDYLYGTYHIPTGVASRYDVACEIVKILKIKTKVHKVSGKQFIDYTAIRPKCEVLKSVKGVEVRDWKEALKEYLDEITKEKN